MGTDDGTTDAGDRGENTYRARLATIDDLARALLGDAQDDAELSGADRRAATRFLREIAASVESAQTVLVGPEAVFEDWPDSDTDSDAGPGTAPSPEADGEDDDTDGATAIPLPDGGRSLPETFTEFARETPTCSECGDRVRDRFLVDGICVGCRHRDESGHPSGDGNATPIRADTVTDGGVTDG